MSRVLIVGSIAFDDIQTPLAEEKSIPGGSAFYGSVSASLLAPVDIVGVAGEDYPEALLEKLRARGIDTRGVERAPGETFRWGGEYRGDMDEAITHFTHLNVFESFDPKIPDEYRDAEVVFLANIHPSLQLKVLDRMRAPKLVMLDTMNYWIMTARDELMEVIRRADVLLLNAGEARMLFATNSLARAGAEMMELGLRRAIIKKGEHGVLMFSREGFFSTPAMPLEKVYDPTGAGDTFAGAFSGYLARAGKYDDEQTFRQAIVAGSAAASFVVEDFSIRRIEKATREEFEERCARLIGAMNVDPIRLG